MGAYLLELPDVSRLLGFGGHQGPELLDLVPLHIKQAGAFGSVEPLMQTGAEVIAAEVLLFEIKLRERMRSVHDRLDSLGPSHVADRFHRRNLAGNVDLVRD